MRRLFTIVMGTTFGEPNFNFSFNHSDFIFSIFVHYCYFLFIGVVIAWTVLTFFGESVIEGVDPITNETMKIDIPRLPIKANYPWKIASQPTYFMTFGFQVYYLLFSVVHSNSSDVLFCSWVLFACEQLQHLKASIEQYSFIKNIFELNISQNLEHYETFNGIISFS
jgi:hypothetical protein